MLEIPSKNSLTPWKPSTEPSISMRAEASAKAIAWSTSPQAALKAARQLAGQWPSANPSDPQEWIKTLAAILGQYPLGVVEECVDPARGLARVHHFPPAGAKVAEWCERRLNQHQGAISYAKQVAAEAEAAQLSDEHCRNMRERIQSLMRGLLGKQQDEEQAA